MEVCPLVSEQAPPPAEGGRRITWEQTAEPVREAIESIAGGKVVESIGQTGGFSPGLAARLRLDNGGWAFAKAANTAREPMAPLLNRAEIKVVERLPSTVPAPAFLGSYDDGDWVALVFEDIDGHQPTLPWLPDELDRVLAGLAELAETLTPAPIELDQVIGNPVMPVFDGWRDVSNNPPKLDLLRSDWPWAAGHLDTLLELEAEFPAVAGGNTLLHCDLRADNILLIDDRVLFVDWAGACVGAAHIDLLFMLPSMAMHGVDAEAVVTKHPVTRELPDRTIDASLAAVAGYFVARSTLPPPTNLPTIRDFQRAQGIAVVDWLAARLG